LFTAALLSLLLYYPRKLAPLWVGRAIIGVFVVWFVAQEIGVFESMTIARRLLVMIGVVCTFVMAGAQWRLTRADPIARAALQWFLLSWLVGVAIFAVFILLPQMFGVDTSALQGYGFLLFLLVYGGLAFGILRFRLFDLGEWWARVLGWIVTILVLVSLDLLFLFGLDVSSSASLALSLLVCGLLWLPLRNWLWGRFLAPPVSERVLFENVVGVALSPPGDDQAARWMQMLREFFDPLHISPTQDQGVVVVERDGLSLVLPALNDIAAMKLEFANGGRRLFTRADLHLARELIAIMRFTLESRSAREAAAAAERSRIASDIHDNVGARPLSALHSRENLRKDGLIREALVDLRNIIDDATRPGASLEDAMATLRRETADRLSARNVQLEWPIESVGPREEAGLLLHTLRSIVREFTSNALKHANARTVRVAIQITKDRAINLQIEGDGIGFDSNSTTSGNGLAILRRRVAAQAGTITWSTPPGGGTRLVVTFPARKEDVVGS
jgi:signal transduction histidine kinase